jgi:hypothetical protein
MRQNSAPSNSSNFALVSLAVRFCVVLLKQSAFPTDQSWVLLFELLVDAVQLLTIKLGVDVAIIWNQLKMARLPQSSTTSSKRICSQLSAILNQVYTNYISIDAQETGLSNEPKNN